MNLRSLVHLALCTAAIFVSALAAQAANGAELRSCGKAAVGSTATRYTSSTCASKSAGGEFETAPVSGSQTVIPKLTSERAVFAGTVSGVEFELSCAGVTSANSKAETVNGGLPAAFVKGSGKTILLGCEVSKPSGVGCVVPETLESTELKSTSSGLTTVYEPATGEEVLTFVVSECTGASIALNGTQVLKGSASSTTGSSTPSSQEFTKSSGSKLKIGAQSIEFTAIVHYKTANGSLVGLMTPAQPTAHECRKETGTGTGIRYVDGTCSAGSESGEFEMVPIVGSQAVKPILTSETVVLTAFYMAGSFFEVGCTGVTSTNSKVENFEAGGAMGVKGSGELQLTGCKGKKVPTGCKVSPETIPMGALTTASNETQLVFSGASMSFEIKECGNPFFNGTKLTVSGSPGAITREAAPTSLEFTTTSGSFPNSQKFTGVIHLQTESGTKLALATP